MSENEKKTYEDTGKTEYLKEIAKELLKDDTWELPKEARFFLANPAFEWDMLYQ